MWRIHNSNFIFVRYTSLLINKASTLVESNFRLLAMLKMEEASVLQESSTFFLPTEGVNAPMQATYSSLDFCVSQGYNGLKQLASLILQSGMVWSGYSYQWAGLYVSQNWELMSQILHLLLSKRIKLTQEGQQNGNPKVPELYHQSHPNNLLHLGARGSCIVD